MKIPFVADIKHNSLDDGPGIRSTVFFKGCPLSCVWCHNPECIKAHPELMYREEACIGCKTCAKTCENAAIDAEAGPAALDRSKCNLAGRCADDCPTGALEIVGKQYSVDDLAAVLLRDAVFYASSSGGVTLSGGEPTLYAEFSGELAGRLKMRDIHLLLETCGHFDWERFESHLLPHLDTVYCDLKVVDADLHERYCGRSNESVLANLDRLLKLKNDGSLDVLVRIPLVPDVTATPENLAATAAFLRERDVNEVALLPYNPLWVSKVEGLGRTARYRREKWLTPEETEAIKAVFEGFTIIGLGA